MARRRYQRGSVSLRGKREKVWVGRWREDVIDSSGQVKRIRKNEVLGTKSDFPTMQLAKRELDRRVGSVNRIGYRALHVATFKEFSEQWARDVVTKYKPSSQASINSQLRCSLVPFFGTSRMKEINTHAIQRFISSCQKSPKTVRNLTLTLKLMWKHARAWGFTESSPFVDLALPRLRPLEQRHFSPEQMRSIISTATEPWRSMFWVASETGMRAGELLALDWNAIDLERRIVWARKSACQDGSTHTTKSAKPRAFVISESLADYWRTRQGDGLVWATPAGKTYNQGCVRRALYGVLERLSIPQAGMHAFRHGNETIMDRLNTPPKLRQQRLGHSDERMMMRYSHVVGEDELALAEALGSMLAPDDVGLDLDWKAVN